MTRLKGKVISRPLTGVPKTGNQVLRMYEGKWHIYDITASDTATSVEVKRRGGIMRILAFLNEIFELSVMQISTDSPRKGLNTYYRPIPLKYSQWQAAIDNGEVDSDKEVEFELVPPMGSIMENGKNHIAKIIPAKKEKLYTQTELEMKCKMAHHYGTIGRKFEDFIDLHLK